MEKSISRLQSLILGTSSRSLSFDMCSSCSLDIPSRSSSRPVSWFESQDLTSSSRHAQDGNARLDAMTLVIPGKGERSAVGSSTSAPSKSLDSSTSLTFSMDSEDLSPSIQSLTDFSPLIASVRFRSRTTSLLRNITSFICCAEQTSFLPNSVTFCTAQVVENVTTLLPLLQKSCWRHSYGIRTSRLSPPPTFHIFSSPPRRAVQDISLGIRAQVRALTDGDITKQQAVFETDCWAALTELDEKAREAEEFKQKPQNH